MKKDLLPVTAGKEYCLSRLGRRYSVEKSRMYEGCFKGVIIGTLAFLSFFFFRYMVRVNIRNDGIHNLSYLFSFT